jgi:hypothetical protein
MPVKIAIKKLSASVCKFFEEVFQKSNVGNQKSINMNADVLVDELYPSLAAIAALTDDQVALPLKIYGPDGKMPTETITRKLIKSASYKNWRLNGETVRGPASDPKRYDQIAAGDLAVMIFKGDGGAPTSMDMILVGARDTNDSVVHTALSALFRKTMISTTPERLAAVLPVTGVASDHPIRLAAFDAEFEADFEDAVLGGITGAKKLQRRGRSRKASPGDAARASAQFQLIGQDGEALVHAYLQEQVAAGVIRSVEWLSQLEAFASRDFIVTDRSGAKLHIDAKSTTGAFGNIIHVSISEMIEASEATPYRIYRVYEISEDGGKLRISEPINALAATVRAIHDAHMPNGIIVDAFSVKVEVLTWGPEIYINRPDEPDEDE